MRKKGLLILFAILAAICASFALSGCGLIGGGNGNNGGNGGTGGGGKPSDEHTHSYVETVIAPTCTKKGYTLHKCSCGDEYKDSETEAMGHLFGEWNVTTPATEEKDGEETRTCTRENCEYIEMRKIPKLDHTHEYTETVVEPTCTEKGYTLHKCECGDEYKDNETPALDHSFTNYVSDGNATCTKDGTKTAKCDRCDETKTIADENSAKGHDYSTEWTIDKEATCTETGIKSHHCTRCEDKTDETEIPLADHNYVDGICTVCGERTLESATGLQYELSKDGTYYIVVGIGTEERTEFAIPASYNGKPVKEIGDSAFDKCGSLTSINIPNSVTSIRECAFFGCNHLTNIIIPDSVTFIGEEAFRNCQRLASITVKVSNLNYKSIDGNLYSKDGKTLIQYAIGKKETLFIIPHSVSFIGNYAFVSSRLTSITIPDSVTSVGAFAFGYCHSLKSVVICDGVVSIGGCAFKKCGLLTNVTIPDSVTRVSFGAFEGCDSIIYNEYDNAYYLGNDINKYIVLVKAKSTDITSCKINEKCKLIYESAFSGCSLLPSITISDSVTSIGYGAFDGCSALTSIVIPESVTSIGISAFRNCTSLMSITIPDSVTSIGSWLFHNCSSLTSIIIPDSVTSLGWQAFYNCSSLTDITYNGTKEEWKNIEKRSEWKDYTGKFTVHCTDGDLTKEEA